MYGEGNAERAGVAGSAQSMPAGFGRGGVFRVFQDAKVDGEKDRFGFRAPDTVLFVAFRGIRFVPLESGDGGPINQSHKNVYFCNIQASSKINGENSASSPHDRTDLDEICRADGGNVGKWSQWENIDIRVFAPRLPRFHAASVLNFPAFFTS